MSWTVGSDISKSCKLSLVVWWNIGAIMDIRFFWMPCILKCYGSHQILFDILEFGNIHFFKMRMTRKHRVDIIIIKKLEQIISFERLFEMQWQITGSILLCLAMNSFQSLTLLFRQWFPFISSMNFFDIFNIQGSVHENSFLRISWQCTEYILQPVILFFALFNCFVVCQFVDLCFQTWNYGFDQSKTRLRTVSTVILCCWLYDMWLSSSCWWLFQFE